MCLGMYTNRNLIGNMLVLLSQRCKPLYHTKLLKLLYLIDEEATKRTGTPITWLSYNVWQFGPVAEDVYHSKWEGLNKFSEFVRFEKVADGKILIKPMVEFDDSSFSELDMQIIDDIIEHYGQLTAKQLVKIVHSKDSLWEKTRQQANIHFSAQNQTSSIPLDFSELLNNDGFKKTIYYSTLENLELQSTLR